MVKSVFCEMLMLDGLNQSIQRSGLILCPNYRTVGQKVRVRVLPHRTNVIWQGVNLHLPNSTQWRNSSDTVDTNTDRSIRVLLEEYRLNIVLLIKYPLHTLCQFDCFITAIIWLLRSMGSLRRVGLSSYMNFEFVKTYPHFTKGRTCHVIQILWEHATIFKKYLVNWMQIIIFC